MTVEKLAGIILEALIEQHQENKHGAPYLYDDAPEIGIDGHVDLNRLAAFILEAIERA